MKENTLKKMVSFFTVMILILSSVSAGTHTYTNTIRVNAIVPENYGVAFPDEALRFGDFVFEVKLDIEYDLHAELDGTRSLLVDDRISIGEIKPGVSEFDFTLVYYGNLSKPYRTEIVVDPNIVWVLEGKGAVTLPIEVQLNRSADCDEDIHCNPKGTANALIEIPPAGPRHDVPVLDVIVRWNGSPDLIPGKYSTEVRLDMRIV